MLPIANTASTGGYRECVIPVDEVDAGVTEQAVESLKVLRQHLYLTLQCVYVRGLGIKRTALMLARAESTIKANLEQADHALAQWFSDRPKPRIL